MFKRKKCVKCGKKVSENTSFCPNCGNNLNFSSSLEDSYEKNNQKKKKIEEDYGMLGKEDITNDPIEKFLKNLNLPPGFNMLAKSIMKNFGKQFQELNKEVTKRMQEEQKRQNKNMNPEEMQEEKNLDKQHSGLGKTNKKGFSISVSSGNNGPPKIKVRSFGNNPQGQQSQTEESQEEQQDTKEEKQEIALPSKFSLKSMKRYKQLPKQEPETKISRLSGKINYEMSLPEVSSIEDVSINKLESSVEIKAAGKNKGYFKSIPINLDLINYSLDREKLVLEFQE